jgi:REP element-mobilizing transposase RayT
MARQPRLHIPQGLYHVIARGNDRQVLFRDEADYREYFTRLRAGLHRHGIRCYAYCLMPNHLHLLLEPGAIPMSRLMQGVQGAFAQYLNRRYRRVGHRFQGRFRAILCEKDSYLLELARYLHLNPVRAGLTRAPEDWPWSSHCAYMERSAEDLPLERNAILGQFHPDPGKARKAFARFVRDGLAMGHRREFYELWEQRVLGDQSFAEKALAPRRPALRLAVKVSVQEILAAVARELGIPVGRILSVGRARGPAHARAVVAYLARELADIPLTSVAPVVRRDPVTLSHAVRRLERALDQTPKIRSRVDRIARSLRQGAKHQKIKRTA